jgi:triosephosphate isomerase
VEGAFTGEVSGAMIQGSGAQYVIVGHSERRAMFAETDTHIRKKVAAALTHSLTPIVCIGETLDQRESGKTFDILDHQIAINLAEIKTEQLAQIVIAYEPVWAIGTGKNATPMQAAEAHKHIRSRLASTFGKGVAAQCHIIYGGSVKPKNIQELITQSDVDGALVGGASLELQAFFEIISRSRKATV